MREVKSRQNPAVIHLRKLGADRRYRWETGQFLCDGGKLLAEAVACDMEIPCVLTSDPSTVVDFGGVDTILVPQDILTYVSPMKTPQTLLFSCRIPKRSPPERCKRVVVLENMQDPGNVGTVIRTAGAFAIDAVVLTGATADLYGPKVVRAAMGALFRQPVAEIPLSLLADFLKARGLALYGAWMGGGALSLGETALEDAAVAIGNEGGGLSEELLAICDGRIVIPVEPVCESLNAAVAASIIMWELYK